MIRGLTIAVCDLIVLGGLCLLLWILGGATEPVRSQPPAGWPGVSPTAEMTTPSSATPTRQPLRGIAGEVAS